ncbi:hypothetical protein A9798_05910 [Edwardsiella hoshinae]|uniref:Putative fimbrial-like adhesin protein StcD n=1 Tax=Edwardsiella hoshinae TaxID=93378 RepID=A0A376DCH9_9GAMM|nr:fimbrial protein [Edwardsiella hoshinae]AOV96529.1 hypothetical protein A9798_05910 [Edwardsiella hoshinae]QPR27579.1 fimbrial protein [Edwardsiella hoshinae]STC86785.1 putative fimbrial-like adhesin protein StcD [Edwardsiella hoshinae]
MNYRRYLFILLVLLSGPALSWCKLEVPGMERQTGQVLMSNQNMFPSGQQVAVPLTLFSKTTRCDKYSSEQNKVYLGTPYTKPIVVKFYDAVYIEFTIQPPPQDTLKLETNRRYTAAQFLDQLVVSAKPVAPTYTQRVANDNGEYRLDTALIISAGSGASDSLGEFIRRLIAFLLSGKWPAKENDLYQLNLTLKLDYKPTTCQFVETTLTLPPVALSDLPQRGEVSGITANHTLVAQCDNLNGELTNRAMKVTLSSDALLAGNARVILPQRGVSGVGFVLYDEQQRPVTLGGSGASASSIKLLRQWEGLPERGFSLPISAAYYVYARNQVQPGKLEANVTINIDYE